MQVASQQAFYALNLGENVELGEYGMTLLLVVLRRINGDEIRKTELAQAYLQPSTLEALVKTMFALPVHSEYDEEAAKYFLLSEEILLALAAVGYFERASAVEGL